ncbi:transposase [Nocardia sp. NPDC004260]
MLYRLRTSSPWRDLPREFGPWQAVEAASALYRGHGIGC